MTIDLATAKAHLRVEHTDEDTLIGAYLSAAQGAVESATGKLLTSQTVEQLLAAFPGSDGPIRLWKGPVTAIVSIAYDDGNGDEQPLADFRLVEGINAKLLPAYGDSWPAAYGAAGSVRVSYTAGYAADEVPPELDQAVLMLVAHYYLNREAVAVGGNTIPHELPLAVASLISPYRPAGLG